MGEGGGGSHHEPIASFTSVFRQCVHVCAAGVVVWGVNPSAGHVLDVCGTVGGSYNDASVSV